MALATKTVNQSALSRAKRGNAAEVALGQVLQTELAPEKRLSTPRKISTILGFGPSAEQLEAELAATNTVNTSALERAKAANAGVVDQAAEAEAAPAAGILDGVGTLAKSISDNVRNSWGLYWPTKFALKKFAGKKAYYLGYTESDGRQHIISSDDIKAVKVNESALEFVVVTDIQTVGSLVLRVGTRLEFMQWVAALHDKWITADDEKGFMVAVG